MKHLNKCQKCGLANGAGEHVCHRCGAMLSTNVGKALARAAEKRRAPRYLFLLPFLVLALGLGYWSEEIKSGTIRAMNIDKEEWHQSMESKVAPKDAPVQAHARELFQNAEKTRQEIRRKRQEKVLEEAKKRALNQPPSLPTPGQ